MNEKQTADRRAIGFAMAFVGGCLWGFSGACGQYLFENKGLTSDWLVPWRLLISGLLMVSWTIARQGRASFTIWRQPRHAKLLVMFGVLGVTGCQYTYFMAIEHSNVGTATVLQYLGPALIMLYLCARARRWPKATEIIVITLDLIGIFLLATHGSIHTMALSKEALFWGLLGAVFVAVYTISPIELLARYDSIQVVGWGMLLGGVLLQIWKRPWTMQVTIDAEVIVFTALVILVGSIAAFTLYIEGVHRIGPAKGSLISSVEPVSAALFAVFWLGVELTGFDLAGFACIIATLAILSRTE